MSVVMIRAERASRRVPRGQDVLAFVGSAKSRKALVAATLEGEPAVSAISKDLAGLLGPKDAKVAQIKQFAGLAVRAVMEEEGFELERNGVWLSNDPLFKSGSVYRRAIAGEKNFRNDLLERFVKILTDEEVTALQGLLRRRR